MTVIEPMVDPFDALYGLGNNDPFWADFPRWLDEYRRSTRGRFVLPED